nr:G protein-coupled receptor [Proales similis]
MSMSPGDTEPNEYRLVALIYQIFTVLFLVVGCINNSLTIMIYSKKRMQKSSYSVYLLALAVVDLLATIFGNTRLMIMAYDLGWSMPVRTAPSGIFKGIDIRELSIVSCRIHRFFTYFLLQMSSVILCLLSIDRFFGVVLALKSYTFKKVSVARKVIVIAFATMFLIDSHFLFAMGHYERIDSLGNSLSSSANRSQIGGTTATARMSISKAEQLVVVCSPDQTNEFYEKFWEIYFYLDSTIYCIIPFFVMIICNSFTIYNMIKSKNDSRPKTASISHRRAAVADPSKVTKVMRRQNNERRISLILIGISLSFLFCTLPVFIIEKNYEETTNWEVALALSYMLMYANHVINFFLYCSLGPRFRKELVGLFTYSRKINPRNRSSRSYSNTFKSSQA